MSKTRSPPPTYIIAVHCGISTDNTPRLHIKLKRSDPFNRAFEAIQTQFALPNSRFYLQHGGALALRGDCTLEQLLARPGGLLELAEWDAEEETLKVFYRDPWRLPGGIPPV